jgi:HIRAN domain
MVRPEVQSDVACGGHARGRSLLVRGRDLAWLLPIAPRSELPLLHVLDTWVAGLHRHPHSSGDDSFAPGEPLLLEAEPDNPHDPLAIGVWNAERTPKIGHVPPVIVDNRRREALTSGSMGGRWRTRTSDRSLVRRVLYL